MTTGKRYLVVADRNGHLSVAVRQDFRPFAGDVELNSFDTIDEAFDWRDAQQHAVNEIRKRHCATCD